jgi:hypothetical protein
MHDKVAWKTEESKAFRQWRETVIYLTWKCDHITQVHTV